MNLIGLGDLQSPFSVISSERGDLVTLGTGDLRTKN